MASILLRRGLQDCNKGFASMIILRRETHASATYANAGSLARDLGHYAGLTCSYAK